MSKYGVLIADDSALMRRTLKRIISEDPHLYVLDTARDGNDAVAKARELKPDVVSMDINMPGLDGITALQIIIDEKICPVVMVSSLTQEGAVTTFECLELGAFDFVPKPGGTVTLDMETVAQDLVRKLIAAAEYGSGTQKRKTSVRETKKARLRYQERLRKPKRIPPIEQPQGTRFPSRIKIGKKMNHKAVAIGVSTGGPKVIFEVLKYLPSDLNAAVFMVQHMPVGFTAGYAQRLSSKSPLPFYEVKAGMVVKPGVGYLGQAGFHMRIFKKLNGDVVIRCSNKPEHQFIPSVDIMMESVLSVYGEQTIGVLLTGMGDDGADSMVKIRESGGFTIAESEESAVVYGMPREAIERGGADVVAPLWDIADEIVKAVNR